MKKIIFSIIASILILTGIAEAKTEICHWIWSEAVTSTQNDPPDYVYCNIDGSATYSMGASYIQNGDKNPTITIIYNTTSTGSLVVDGVTICSNTGTPDVNILLCAEGTCSTGTTTVVFYQVDDIADAIVNGFGMTPINSFKITVDEDAGSNGCLYVTSVVTW